MSTHLLSRQTCTQIFDSEQNRQQNYNKTSYNVSPRWIFYLIWSTSGSLWHHVDVSGLIVVHGQFTLGAEHSVGRSFTCDGLASSATEYRSTLQIPTKKEQNDQEVVATFTTLQKHKKIASTIKKSRCDELSAETSV